MTDYKPGDLVSLEHTETGQAMVNFTVEASGSLMAIRSIWRTEPVYLHHLPDGWRVTDHKPKIELPTEDGAYIDARGDVWVLADRHWVYADTQAHLASEVAPLTRLVPEGSEREAAIREVIEHYEQQQYGDGFIGTHQSARKRFGLTT